MDYRSTWTLNGWSKGGGVLRQVLPKQASEAAGQTEGGRKTTLKRVKKKRKEANKNTGRDLLSWFR